MSDHSSETFRVSFVEKYRTWRDDDEADLDALFDDRESEPQRVGIAFHKALETLQVSGVSESALPEITANGYTLEVPDDWEVDLSGVCEVRTYRRYIIDNRPITLTGRCDNLVGLRCDDHKFTAKLDAERYFSGYQWRFYLELFRAEVFRWNVFVIKPDRNDLGRYAVSDLVQLEQHRYPGMDVDCRTLMTDFARFIRSDPVMAYRRARTPRGEPLIGSFVSDNLGDQRGRRRAA